MFSGSGKGDKTSGKVKAPEGLEALLGRGPQTSPSTPTVTDVTEQRQVLQLLVAFYETTIKVIDQKLEENAVALQEIQHNLRMASGKKATQLEDSRQQLLTNMTAMNEWQKINDAIFRAGLLDIQKRVKDPQLSAEITAHLSKNHVANAEVTSEDITDYHKILISGNLGNTNKFAKTILNEPKDNKPRPKRAQPAVSMPVVTQQDVQAKLANLKKAAHTEPAPLLHQHKKPHPASLTGDAPHVDPLKRK